MKEANYYLYQPARVCCLCEEEIQACEVYRLMEHRTMGTLQVAHDHCLQEWVRTKTEEDELLKGVRDPDA